MPWRGLALIGLAVLVLGLLAPLRGAADVPVFYLAFLSIVLFWIAQATSWNILSGYSGYFSFGQGAFFGVGAYTTAVLAGRHGIDFFLTIPFAGGLALALALAVGALAFRLRSLRGEIFALLTLAVPFIIAPLARFSPSIDGGQGIVLRVPPYVSAFGGFQDFVYLVSLAIAGLAIAIAYAIQHSRTGWALFAIRDAESVAEGLGVPTFRYKMLAIAITGFIAGMSGSVWALNIGFITVETVFTLTVPLFVIVMSVLGGRSHWLGPALGALVIATLRDRLAVSGFEGMSLIILGTILAVLILIAPEGLLVRLRARPRHVGIALGAVVAPLAVLSVWIVPVEVGGVRIENVGSPLDWLTAGMIAAAVTAFWPARRRADLAAGMAGVAEPLPEAVEEAVVLDSAPAPAATPTPTSSALAEHVAPDADRLGALRSAESGTMGPDRGRLLVECRDVAKRFGGIQALTGVSLNVHEGELVGLVGPNGSGKTTLVNLLSGAFRPTSGEIRVDGASIVAMPGHRIAHIGVARTYQIPRPFESMTVRDNVAVAIMFGREPRSLDAARDAAQEHLDLVGLSRLAAARPHEINLHERQLLELARALASRPKVLLLDEALAGLNPVEVDSAVEVVRQINDSGIAIVIVEHVLRVVNQLAQRVVVLEQGRMLAEGDPATVMRDPKVVRAYLGSEAGA